MHDSVKAFQLRDYQVEDRAKVAESFFDRGITRQLGVWATGLGKTVLFSELHLEERFFHSRKLGKKILVIAHRDELIKQAVDKIQRSNPYLQIGIEKANKRHSRDDDVVVASVQTLTASGGRRLRQMNPEEYDIVVIDEAHHGASPSYLAIAQHFGFLPPPSFMQELRPEKADGRQALLDWQRMRLDAWDRMNRPDRLLLGVTATPKRGDKIGLEVLFQEITFNRDIRFGIQNDWLCPLRAFRVETATNLDNVKTRAGDFAEEELAKAINQAQRNAIAVKAYLNHAAGRKGITFCANVAHAITMAEAYNKAGVKAAFIHGKLKDHERAEVLRKFRAGEIRMLTNCQILTEGFDEPDVQVIIHARPTKSPLLYCLDTQTEILTSEGWKDYNGLAIGDTVAAFDTFSGRIKWEQASYKLVRPLTDSEFMIGIGSSTMNMRVSDKHRMVLYNEPTRSYDVVAAEDVLRRESATIPVAGVQGAIGIPLTPAEIAFCGLVQTDGSFNKANGCMTISQSTAATEACAYIERVLNECGFKWRFTDTSDSTNFGPRTAPQRTYRISRGKPRGLDKDKRGWEALAPWIWKAGGNWRPWEMISVAQFRVLVQGLWWGDGLKHQNIDWKNYTTTISCGDKNWVDKFQSLAVRRGWRCNVSEHNYNQEPIYYVRLREIAVRFMPIRPSDNRPHLAAETYKPETVWCISVPSGAFLARRNGKAFVTGNCQMTGRGTRITEGKQDCIVIDIVDLTKKHSLITAPELLGLPANWDAKGGDLLEQAQRFEAIAKDNPMADLTDVKDIEECQLRVSEVDLLGQFHDETLEAHASLVWQRTGEGYELDWRGRLLPEFITISKNGDNWTVTKREGKIINWTKQTDTAENALRLSEDYLKRHQPGVYHINRKAAPWRTQPAEENQKKILRSMGIKLNMDNLTKGDAANLIGRYWTEQRKKKVGL